VAVPAVTLAVLRIGLSVSFNLRYPVFCLTYLRHDRRSCFAASDLCRGISAAQSVVTELACAGVACFRGGLQADVAHGVVAPAVNGADVAQDHWGGGGPAAVLGDDGDACGVGAGDAQAVYGEGLRAEHTGADGHRPVA
jgi:hypothetical protein